MSQYRIISPRLKPSQVLYAGADGSIIALQLSPMQRYGTRDALGSFSWFQMPQYRDPGTGYWKVSVQSNSGNDLRNVHQLICEAWNSPVEGKTKALHRNNNKDDNRACNLYWGDNIDQKTDGQERVEQFLHSQQSLSLHVQSCPTGLEGTLWRNGQALQLPALPTATGKQKTNHSIAGLANELVYRFRLFERGVRDFAEGFPEKIRRVAPSWACMHLDDEFPPTIKDDSETDFSFDDEEGTTVVDGRPFYNAFSLSTVGWRRQ